MTPSPIVLCREKWDTVSEIPDAQHGCSLARPGLSRLLAGTLVETSFHQEE